MAFASPRSTARRGCQKLAEDGDPVAQRQLGTLYQTGVGVSQSNEIALSWYRAAADQGDVIAFYNLGVMYDGGLGVEQDHAAAAHPRNAPRDPRQADRRPSRVQ